MLLQSATKQECIVSCTSALAVSAHGLSAAPVHRCSAQIVPTGCERTCKPFLGASGEPDLLLVLLLGLMVLSGWLVPLVVLDA